MVSFGGRRTRNSMNYFVLSYYLLDVGATETTIFSVSFVTWSQIPISCDQRHLWDPQNKQLTWVFLRERDNSAPSTILWWGSTLKTQLPHPSAKMICPWMLSLFSLLGPENLGRPLSPDTHQEKWADHHSTIRDKNPCDEMHLNTHTTHLRWHWQSSCLPFTAQQSWNSFLQPGLAPAAGSCGALEVTLWKPCGVQDPPAQLSDTPN